MTHDEARSLAGRLRERAAWLHVSHLPETAKLLSDAADCIDSLLGRPGCARDAGDAAPRHDSGGL
jgi:hypothetical protein